MSSKTAVAVLFFSTIALSTAFGQGKADEKLAPAVQDFSKEAYVIEKLSTRIVEESDGSGTRERTAEIRILADAGVKTFAVLNFPYTSANETVDIDYVRVRQPDGTVVKTPDYNIQDMPADVTRSAPMYSDIHEKHVAVKGLGVGGILEYLVRYRIVKPQVPGQFWYEESFSKDAIVKNETLELSVPADKYLKVASPDFKPEIKNEGGRRVYVWSHSNLIVKEKDPNESPRRIPPSPSVQVTTFASWEEIGRWYGGLQKDPLEVTPAIQAKAVELTKGLRTNDEKIRALYNFVSLQFHYVGLDFGIGRYQPHAADDVLGNGYGDCKDKHTLLAALLKAVGIDAWPALIHATRKLDPDIPSPAQFNHVITVVPEGDQMIWLDTTPEVAPYQLLLLTLRDKKALVIPSDKPPLVMTTLANPPNSMEQTFSAEGKLDAAGTYTAHVEQTYRGDVEVMLRYGFRQLSQSQWKDGAQRFSYGMGFAGDVSNVTITPPDDTSKPFHISYDYVRKGYSDWDNRQITPPVPPMGVEVTKDTKKPQESVLLGGLGEVSYRSKLTLPPGYTIETPKSLDVVQPFAEYHTTASVNDGILTSSRRLVIKKSEVELSDWADYRAFGMAISDDENKYIHLNGEPGTANGGTEHGPDSAQKFRDATGAMRTGDYLRAQELLEQLIHSDPTFPSAHLNLGIVLMTQRKNTEASAEWHKEQEMHPDSLDAYRIPAIYLTYLNRPDDAILEWRKLLKADPKNHDAAMKLSGLLASENKNADAAAVLEDAVKESPDSLTLEMALGDMYVKDGQPEKGIAHIEKVMHAEGNSKEIDPGMLNDAAYMLAVNKSHLDVAKQYAEKAVAELDARSIATTDSDDTTIPADFTAVWDTLGWIYFQMGDAAKAESYLRSAWILGQQSTVGDHLGQTYAKLGKKKQAEHVYELALSARFLSPAVTGAISQNSATSYQASRDQILTHYQELTGRKGPPVMEIRRLPNGEWTKTRSDELEEMTEVKISNTTSLSCVTFFSVVFAPGKVEKVRYISGDERLKSMMDKLETAPYQMEFPVGSAAKIVRRVTLTCHPNFGCTAEMQPPNQVRPKAY